MTDNEYAFSGNNYGIDEIPKAMPRGKSAMTYNADRSQWAEQVNVRSRDILVKNVKIYAQQFTKEAIDTLHMIMVDPEASRKDKIAAANSLILHGHGRPAQMIEIEEKREKLIINAEEISPETEKAIGELLLLFDAKKINDS